MIPRISLIVRASFVLATVMPASAEADPAGPREERAEYVLVGESVVVSANVGWLGVLPVDAVRFGTVCDGRLGGACFAVQPGDAAIALRIEDASGLTVSARYAYRDAAGAALASGRVCGSTGTAVPEGALRLDVLMEWAATCPSDPSSIDLDPTANDPEAIVESWAGSGLVKTKGTVTATFT